MGPCDITVMQANNSSSL